ncbi:M23 family metallopeptidase [Paenibacillus macquariensis]|uniref:Peptidase family M23 n=1 Tax=Paenibacillus macquariensis TaxID=948756 RepID=A0ABY1JSM8_9BACL|nr:M23 family metallopeptidase [Paenibacillus macquariensis]MEC0092927.1 M23 family metallopeptidase [Paenibacillus macquariensis]OAB36293.1 hypothetical protein PMSM_07550 [Paenibacillus macquariensis subsp. macquariensis]SIQ68909.1 Peptidase family M23 [Paenibacillus macquariensis]
MNPFESYRLTSPFGMRMHPVYQILKFHKGVDLVRTPSMAPINAFVAGEVIHAKEGMKGSGFGGYGIVVAIKDNKGYLHCYAHLSAVLVKVGDMVKRGQKVGLQGSTGVSTGAHLHYEIRKAYSPSYGYTETEIGVVEPTKYLQDFYSNEEISNLNKKDANAIIDKYLKPAWGNAKTPADKQEIGRLADELRVASGQMKQNG